MRTAEPTSIERGLLAADVLDALTGSAVSQPVDIGTGDLRAVQSIGRSMRVLFVCFDYSRHQGSIGTLEAEQLVRALRLARGSRLGLVFLLETSGIRVTDGTAGIASLRKVLREAEDARLDGVRMLAMILKSAFGGASILASMCEQRLIHAGCLFSMTGPKLIEQSVGADQFCASDKDAIRQLLGGEARSATSDGFSLVEPTAEAYRAGLEAWLTSDAPPALTIDRLHYAGLALAARLDRPLTDPVAIHRDAPLLEGDANRILREIHPEGCDLQLADGVLVTHPHADSSTRVLGLLARDGAGARHVLTLAREILRPIRRGSHHARCVLLVDCESHLGTPADERVVLSEVLAHLALVIRAVHRHGQRVDVVVTGHGGGGIQGALGSGASSVAMSPRAHLFVLPGAAMQALNKAEDALAGSIQTALSVGAIDHSYTLAGHAPGGPHHVV